MQHCQICRKPTKKIYSHHVIPRWINKADTEIIEICHVCHNKIEHKFFNLIRIGQINNPYRNNHPNDKCERNFVCFHCRSGAWTVWHHLVPYWLDGTEEDIVEVCRPCHVRLENRFNNFIRYGYFTAPKWYDSTKRREYFRKRHRTEAWKQYMREYYQKNKQKIIAQKKVYYQKNIDRLRQYGRNYHRRKTV